MHSHTPGQIIDMNKFSVRHHWSAYFVFITSTFLLPLIPLAFAIWFCGVFIFDILIVYRSFAAHTPTKNLNKLIANKQLKTFSTTQKNNYMVPSDAELQTDVYVMHRIWKQKANITAAQTRPNLYSEFSSVFIVILVHDMIWK